MQIWGAISLMIARLLGGILAAMERILQNISLIICDISWTGRFMSENLLLITDRKKDQELFGEILAPKGFKIESLSSLENIEQTILKDHLAAIIADYDLIGEKADDYYIPFLQNNRSKACFILYGEKPDAEKVAKVLQTGAYAFVPRELLSKRIYETIKGGLENRKAFVEIIALIDNLKDMNKTLQKEKESLRIVNRNLDFINRLSSEVAYDMTWTRILPRILDAGLQDVIDYDCFGILYQIGHRWNLALHLSEKGIDKELLEKLRDHIISAFSFLSGERVSTEDLDLHIYTTNAKVSSISTIDFSKNRILPLTLAGKPLGILFFLPENGAGFENSNKELMSTISNILAISLKNAQEYHHLKAMAVRDGLTGILNYKGFQESIEIEFQKARRYKKALSLVMIDVDNFKAINDSLGHQAGDLVLQELAGCLQRSLRKGDIVARYGGDEFAILLPETDMKKAQTLMERIDRGVRVHAFRWDSQRMDVGITFGISSISELGSGSGQEEFIRRADSRLYGTKRLGTIPYPATSPEGSPRLIVSS